MDSPLPERWPVTTVAGLVLMTVRTRRTTVGHGIIFLDACQRWATWTSRACRHFHEHVYHMGAFCNSHMASDLPRIYLPLPRFLVLCARRLLTECSYDIRNQPYGSVVCVFNALILYNCGVLPSPKHELLADTNSPLFLSSVAHCFDVEFQEQVEGGQSSYPGT